MRPTLALCLLVAAACGGSTPDVDFVATPLTPAEAESWEKAGIRSAHHEITVRRTFRTPTWCRELEADAVRTASDVTLRVMALRSDDPCPPGEGVWGYMAVIHDLAPGRYDLRVVHTYDTPGRPSEVVLSHSVLVE